jgi:hypothetical protein
MTGIWRLLPPCSFFTCAYEGEDDFKTVPDEVYGGVTIGDNQ